MDTRSTTLCDDGLVTDVPNLSKLETLQVGLTL